MYSRSMDRSDATLSVSELLLSFDASYAKDTKHVDAILHDRRRERSCIEGTTRYSFPPFTLWETQSTVNNGEEW